MKHVSGLVAVAAAVAVASVPAMASAGPVALTIGTGMRGHLSVPEPDILPLDENAPGGEVVGALIGTLALRLPLGFAIGVHGGASWRSYRSAALGDLRSASREFDLIPVDVGVTLEYALGRAWISPWIGRHYTRRTVSMTTCEFSTVIPSCSSDKATEWTNDRMSVGVTAGIDAWISGPHRVGVFVDLQTGTNDYSAISIGASYRI